MVPLLGTRMAALAAGRRDCDCKSCSHFHVHVAFALFTSWRHGRQKSEAGWRCMPSVWLDMLQRRFMQPSPPLSLTNGGSCGDCSAAANEECVAHLTQLSPRADALKKAVSAEKCELSKEPGARTQRSQTCMHTRAQCAPVCGWSHRPPRLSAADPPHGPPARRWVETRTQVAAMRRGIA